MKKTRVTALAKATAAEAESGERKRDAIDRTAAANLAYRQMKESAFRAFVACHNLYRINSLGAKARPAYMRLREREWAEKEAALPLLLEVCNREALNYYYWHNEYGYAKIILERLQRGKPVPRIAG